MELNDVVKYFTILSITLGEFYLPKDITFYKSK